MKFTWMIVPWVAVLAACAPKSEPPLRRIARVRAAADHDHPHTHEHVHEHL